MHSEPAPEGGLGRPRLAAGFHDAKPPPMRLHAMSCCGLARSYGTSACRAGGCPLRARRIGFAGFGLRADLVSVE
jgi:hypothetical protein